MQFSKVGQNIQQQVVSLGNQAKADCRARPVVQAQGQALQQQVAILAPDVKAQKIKDFETRRPPFRVWRRKGSPDSGRLHRRRVRPWPRPWVRSSSS